MVSLDNLKTGEAGGGITDRTGQVRLANVVRGTYKVTIRPPETEFVSPLKFDAAAEDGFAGEGAEEEDAAEEDPFAALIPVKYRNIDTTPLALEVKEEILEYRFELKEKAPEEDDVKEDDVKEDA